MARKRRTPKKLAEAAQLEAAKLAERERLKAEEITERERLEAERRAENERREAAHRELARLSHHHMLNDVLTQADAAEEARRRRRIAQRQMQVRGGDGATTGVFSRPWSATEDEHRVWGRQCDDGDPDGSRYW